MPVNSENSKMNLKEKMEQIYRTEPPDKIPWNITHPPKPLVKLVETGKVMPCKAIDLGCGTGNYAIWLAQRGFQMSGIDFSESAIQLASKKALRENVNCKFFVDDLTDNNFNLNTKFEFAYDWEVLHHIFPDERETYFKNIDNILQVGAKYFSVCFSEMDQDFGGEGKYRTTPMETTLYFSSESEIERALDPYFEIESVTTNEIAGKYGSHIAIVALAIKK
jgi:2-polyprenyl-3-methyl-5-hydroxy-6-metoxy-1,4-benzoquinol methylase